MRLAVTVDLGAAGTITIATGPVITGSALRDAAGITFGEFTNQIDYQNVGTARNRAAGMSAPQLPQMP